MPYVIIKSSLFIYFSLVTFLDIVEHSGYQGAKKTQKMCGDVLDDGDDLFCNARTRLTMVSYPTLLRWILLLDTVLQ